MDNRSEELEHKEHNDIEAKLTNRAPWPIWSAIAASAGGVLGLVVTLAIILPHGDLVYTPYDSGVPVEAMRKWAEPGAHLLTTLSLGGLYVLLGGWRSRLGTVGAILAVVSLAALHWFLFHPPRVPASLEGNIIGYLAYYGKPAALLLFFAAALRARRWWWALLIFMVGVADAPLTVILITLFSLSISGAEWSALLFGLPGMGSGLIESSGWAMLGGVILWRGRKLQRRRRQQQMREIEERNCQQARRLYEEVFGAGNVSVVGELVANDFFDYRRQRHGPQELGRTVVELRHTFPDLHLRVEDQRADGQEITTRCTFSGTDRGGVLYYPPTNRKATFAGTFRDQFSEGKLIAHRGETDIASLLRQLGLPAKE